MIYIHAETEREARDYARDQGLRGAKVAGNRSRSCVGMHFTSDDTIYVLPNASREHLAVLRINLRKAPTQPKCIKAFEVPDVRP